MLVIIEITYIKPLEEVDKYLAEHRAFLKGCYEKNLLLASGPQMPRKGGVIIAVGSLDSVKSFIKEDPFYREGIGDYRFIPFDPVLHAKVFEPYLTEK